MKIRTDFVTNSSSSSFVTYRLTNSEFCKYLYEQMQKNGFTYREIGLDHPDQTLHIDENSLELYPGEPTYRMSDYKKSDRRNDIKDAKMYFLREMARYIPFEKVDDLDKLYDAFLEDLKNGRLYCDVEIGGTD